MLTQRPNGQERGQENTKKKTPVQLVSHTSVLNSQNRNRKKYKVKRKYKKYNNAVHKVAVVKFRTGKDYLSDFWKPGRKGLGRR